MLKVEIKIKGKIDKDWEDWLGNLKISHNSCGHTFLTGFIRDQAALRGILNKLADLGLWLMSVSTVSINTTGRGKEA
jgi:hypothetical protein